MENKILVTYATMSGSTQEIAEDVANELGKLGVRAEVRPAREVKNLSEYSAVVVGAPLYMFHLHKDAQQFFNRHQKNLSALPVAVFAGGAFGQNYEKDSIEVRKNLDAELAKFTWLVPTSVLLVGGKFDPARLRFPYNLIPAMKATPPSDCRNWEEIRAWAQSLPALFASESEERSLS